MAKEFQHFNKVFAKHAGTALKVITSKTGSIAKSDIDSISGWYETEGLEFTEDYSHEKIRFCVYEAPDATEWQRFRVSLKGLNTKEKLYALGWWWSSAEQHFYTNQERDKVRVNNYLGALKRSGHLDANLKVAKL